MLVKTLYNKKDNLIIVTQTNPDTDMVYKKWNEYGYKTAIMFTDYPAIMKAVRRIWLLSGLPGGKIWCGSWIDRLDHYSTLILHSNNLSGFLPGYLEKRYPHLRIIYWYWNKVNKYTNPKRIKCSRTEFWSFNYRDCQKYGMDYNIQYYYEVDEKSEILKSDIFFIGHDHGRRKKIEKIRKEAEKQGLRCDFEIISSNKKNIPYDEVRRKIASAKAVLEINQSSQDGYTLRALESLFFGKKLITDNKRIRELPFYSRSNVYIIGREKRSLKEFLEIPYDNTFDIYRSKFDIHAWINNFFRA